MLECSPLLTSVVQIIFQPPLCSLIIKLATSRCKEQQVIPAHQRRQNSVSMLHSMAAELLYASLEVW